MSFDELQLSPPILKALVQCGHHQPTPVQIQAIPKALAGRDIIASAQTGTGKTAAFVLPALQRLSEGPSHRTPGPRVLVLTPTRELADQVTQSARMYGRYAHFRSVAIYGGMPFGEQIRSLSQSPEMVVATPGRLLDHMDRRRIDLSHIEMFVLDEADRMLDMGFIDDVERIASAVPENCQRLLFAATVGDATRKLAQKLLKNPERVEVAPGRITHDRIEQRLHLADNLQHKNRLLQHVCADSAVTRAIIFSATKRDADGLARTLSAQGYAAAALHGDMNQSARNRTMLNMRRGKIRFLVATDVAARGLDVTGITHIINFDLPRFAEDYVHRIGRTGRAGAAGIAISFASRVDLPYLDRIERYIGQNLAMHVIPGLEPAHPLVRPAGGRKAPFVSLAGNRTGGKTAWSEDRPFKHKHAGGGSGYAGDRTGGRSTWSESRSFKRGDAAGSRDHAGNGKRSSIKWLPREVSVEYRSAGPNRAGRPGTRKPGE